VLVRMRNDRNGGKRTNWLLIKHRDEYARDDKGDIILDEDKSVASGRAMSEIAAGKGKAPKPFMLAKNGRGKSDAVWNSNRGMAADARAERETEQPSKSKSSKSKSSKVRHVAAIPGFIAPQLCVSVEKPPEGGGWGHEIKLDGYRLQLRIEDGEVTLKTRKGLDWTEKFAAIAKEAGSLPDALIDGEVVALDAKGDPDFSALQATLSDGKTGNLIFFAFDLLFADEFDLRRSPLSERKQRLQDMLEGRTLRKESLIRYLDHVEAGGEAVWQTACKMSLEGIISKKLGASYQSGRSENWTKTKCRAGHEVVLGGWKTTNGKFRSLMAGVYRGDHLAHVGIVGTGFGQDKRQECAEENQRCALAEAGACRRDRICRLYCGRKCPPGGVQGTASGQAGKRSDGGEASHDRDSNASSGASFSQNLQRARRRFEKGRQQILRSDGRRHLKTRQGAVARRRRWRAGHQA
jgi:bifunctional non-homologous end joining protein LigD